MTVEELKAWIKFAQKRWIYEDVERQWKGHDLNEDGLVSWEEYKNATYGYILGRSWLLGRAFPGASSWDFPLCFRVRESVGWRWIRMGLWPSGQWMAMDWDGAVE